MLPSRGPNRTSLILLLAILIICGLWFAASSYIVPGLIKDAYYGRSWPIFNRMITGRSSHSLTEYLISWNQLSLKLLLAFLIAAFLAVLLFRPEFQIRLGSDESTPIRPKREEPGRGHTPRPASHDFGSRGALGLFGAIFLIATALRVIFLGNKSLFQDEMASLTFSLSPWRTLWEILSKREANMSLYYGILHIWLRLGSSEIAIRSLSVILALAALLVLYVFATRLFGTRAALLAAFLLTINGFAIEYSQDARSYALLVLLATLSSCLFVRCVERGLRRDWLGYVAASSLAIYAHLFAALVLLSQWTSLLFLPRRRVSWRRWIVAGITIGILGLPMALFVLLRNTGQLNWVPRTTAASIYGLFAHLSGYADLVHLRGSGPSLVTILFGFMLLASLVAVIRTSFSPDSPPEAWRLSFLFAWLVLPILVTVGISFVKPILVDRFLIICLPPFVLISAFSLSRIRRNLVRAALLVVIVGFTAQGLVSYYKSPGVQDWRTATDCVLRNARPGDAVLFAPVYVSEEFAYYRKELAAENGPLRVRPTPIESNLSQAPGGFFASLPESYSRVWLVGRQESLREQAMEETEVESKLATVYPKAQTTKLAGVVVILYSK